jgi:hypothetical protein
MRRHIVRLQCALSLLAATLTAPVGLTGAQVPAGEEPVRVITDYELPPSTLDGAWARAAAIVRVRIEHSRSRHRGNVPVTEHTVTVLEVFKGDTMALGQQILVFQDSVDDAVPGPKHTSGGPVFTPAEEYVLFLDRATLSGTWHVSWGPGGVLSMTREAVPVNSRRMWSDRAEVPRAEVLSTLRLMRETRSGK